MELLLPIYTLLSFVLTVLLFAISVVHGQTKLNQLTCQAGLLSADHSCYGYFLNWNTNNVSVLQDSNAEWRNVFSLTPDLFLDHWFPFVCAVVTLNISHVTILTKSWLHQTVWFFTITLFSTFGYAGNLGVIGGFISFFVTLVCSILSCTNVLNPNQYYKKNKNKRIVPKYLETPSVNRAINWLYFTLHFLTATLTIAIGCIHITTNLPNACAHHTKGYNTCIGPAILWNEYNPFLLESNGNGPLEWRSTFTFAPSTFFETFGPFLCGVYMLLHFFPIIRKSWFSKTWNRMCFGHLGVALFLNFGYVGNLGIIVGTISSICSIFCFLVHFFIKTKVPMFPNLVGIIVGGEGSA